MKRKRIIDIIDYQNNERHDLKCFLSENSQIHKILVPSPQRVSCAHCFEERRRTRSCERCTRALREFTDSPSNKSLSRSTIITSMLKDEGLINDAVIRSAASGLPWVKQASRQLLNSSRYKHRITCMVLKHSGIAVGDRVFYSEELVKKLFDTNLDNVCFWSEAYQDVQKAPDIEEASSTMVENTRSSGTMKDIFSRDVKDRILPNYESRGKEFFRFLCHAVQTKKRTFLKEKHRSFFEKYMQLEMEFGQSEVTLIRQMIRLLETVFWLQFIRTIVPPEYKSCAEKAYAYVNDKLLI